MTSSGAVAFFPGSFDPIHNGHLDVIEQAADLFGAVVVATMYNPSKPDGSFTLAERQTMIAASVAHVPNTRVEAFAGLAVDAATAVGASFIVKGLRTAGDFEIEMQMAHTNFSVTGVRTVFLPTSPQWSFVSSRFVREIAHYGGEVSHLVPAPVAAMLAERRGSR